MVCETACPWIYAVNADCTYLKAQVAAPCPALAPPLPCHLLPPLPLATGLAGLDWLCLKFVVVGPVARRVVGQEQGGREGAGK